MGEEVPTSTEDLGRGFRRELKDAVNAALDTRQRPVGDDPLDRLHRGEEAQRNPHHDYRVFFD